MTLAVLADRIAVLRDVEQIEADLIVFEQQYGLRADAEALRHRLTTTRAIVLEQLVRALVNADTTTPDTTVH